MSVFLIDLEFSNYTALNRHKRRVHGIGKLSVCPYCEYKSYRADILAVHIRTKHGTENTRQEQENTVRSSRRVSRFTCKHCCKLYKKEECEQMGPSGVMYKCFLPNCEEVCGSFSIFRDHHVSTCPERIPD